MVAEGAVEESQPLDFLRLHDADLQIERVFWDFHADLLGACDPGVNRVAHIGNSFFAGLALANAAGEARYFGHPTPIFVVWINDNLSHGIQGFESRSINARYTRQLAVHPL